jgi:hypothetical protein
VKKLLAVLGLSAVITAVGLFGIAYSEQPQQSALIFTANHHDAVTGQ